MDVLSLLNKSATSGNKGSTKANETSCFDIPVQENLSLSSLPTPSPDRTTPQQDWVPKTVKSRTPWSAGGYILPIHSDAEVRTEYMFSSRYSNESVDSKALDDSLAIDSHPQYGPADSTWIDSEHSQHSLPSRRNHMSRPIWEEPHHTRTETPESLGHSVSDSRSSFSSFASWRSRSHSRMSSATTVNGIHSTGQSQGELPLLEEAVTPYGESYHRKAPAKRVRQSPGGQAQQYHHGHADDAKHTNTSDVFPRLISSSRPLYARALTSDHSNTGPCSTLPSMSHKRAISAPVSYLSSNSLRRPSTLLRAPREVMDTIEDGSSVIVERDAVKNDASPQGGNGIRKTDSYYTIQRDGLPTLVAPKPRRIPFSLDSPVLLDHEQQSDNRKSLGPVEEDEMEKETENDEEPVCMFVDDCDTGSQLRKAISHLFGRNKTCTLKIPKMVWVYYCRKHYQRIRYRNARSYPVTQMELVETQIERLAAWSDHNRACGKGAYIKSWTLSLRKREEKRLKGGMEEDVEGTAAVGASPIPQWIVDEVGEGHNTAKMFEVAARLRQEIEKGALTQIPEIEFLPDIVDDAQDKDSGKSLRHRKQSSSMSVSRTPKRKANGVASFNDMSRGARGQEQRSESNERDSPNWKRPRMTRAATMPHQPETSTFSESAMAGHQQYFAAQPAHIPGTQSSNARIVPNMQPMKFKGMHRRAATIEKPYASSGHARVASYHVSHEREYALESGYQYQHGQNEFPRRQEPCEIPARVSNSNSPPNLPSVAMQNHGSSVVHRYSGLGKNLKGGIKSHGSDRWTHQRSASAYTLNTGNVTVPCCPTNFHCQVAENDEYRHNPQGRPSEPYYNAGQQVHQVLDESEWPHRQHTNKPGWVPEHGYPVPPTHDSYYSTPRYGPPYNEASAPRHAESSMHSEPVRRSNPPST